MCNPFPRAPIPGLRRRLVIIPDGMMNTGIFGRGHLERVLSAFLEHYHRARPHQGLEQQLPRPPAEARPVPGGELVREDRLGGLIHEYRWAA